MSQEEAEEPLRSLSLDYLNLLINGEAFSDVTFSVEGRLVHAHRCILAARSLFFRKLFCGPQDALPFPLSSRCSSSSSSSSSSSCGGGVVIPVTSVGYDVFLLVLQFLYSGQVSIAPPPKNESSRPSSCSDRRCWHAHCSATVDLALDTLAAARSFGVEQLVLLAQRQLASMVEKASIEDVMRVLMASRKHDLPHLWASCSHLVANSGLPSDVLAKHLSLDTLARIEDLRLNSSSSPRRAFSSFSNDDRYHHHNNHRHHNHHHHHHHQKVRRMRRALDSSDVELVRLMVMSEGLNLDDALALHYAVERCTREVVKALLELGAADVNRPAGPSGKTPLHVAAEMACPDMVAVLLDHHADPNSRTADGVTPLDILRSLTSDFLFKGAAVPGLAHIEPNKLRLCLELVQSAAMVASREEEAKTTAGNVNVGFSPDAAAMYTSMHPESSNSNGMGNPSFDSRMLYLNLGMAAAAAAAQFGYNKMSDGSEEDKSSSNRSQGCGGGFGPSSMYSPHGFP